MTHARRGVGVPRGLVIIRVLLRFRAEISFAGYPLPFRTRETTDHSVGVVPICPVFGPPFYITRRCPFNLTRETIELRHIVSSLDGFPITTDNTFSKLLSFAVVILTSLSERVVHDHRTTINHAIDWGRYGRTSSDEIRSILTYGYWRAWITVASFDDFNSFSFYEFVCLCA